MPSTSDTVTLVGAGLTGPLLAISLVQRGFRVAIYERRADPRRVRLSAGRSINLAISVRGIHALREAGLWESMRNIIIPMKGRMMHSLSGELTFQPYGKDETEVINSISRADLNAALMNDAEKCGVQIHFDERCIGLDLHAGIARFRNERTGSETDVDSGVIIGADGASSAVRLAMLKLNRFNLSQQYLDYGYKELTIAAGPDTKHLLEPNALHIWPRGSHMLIALPNVDGTFACILFPVSYTHLDVYKRQTEMRGAMPVRQEDIRFGKTIRLFGAGWPLKPYGYFSNAKLGRFLAFVTDWQKMVLVVFPNKRLLVSPDNPKIILDRFTV